jgi:hypothetical protein
MMGRPVLWLIPTMLFNHDEFEISLLSTRGSTGSAALASVTSQGLWAGSCHVSGVSLEWVAVSGASTCAVSMFVGSVVGVLGWVGSSPSTSVSA